MIDKFQVARSWADSFVRKLRLSKVPIEDTRVRDAMAQHDSARLVAETGER
jgi:hypothetical protein